MVCGGGGAPMAFPWTVGTCSEGFGSGEDRRAKRLLQQEKEQKTTWSTRREFSDEGGGDADNGANPQHVPVKNNGKKHSDIPTMTNGSRTTRSSQGHPTIMRVMHGGIELVLKYRPSEYASTHSFGVRPASQGQRRGKARAIQRARKTISPNSSEIADICELHMKKGTTQSMLHETRRARAQSPDGTFVGRVERVKEGWGDIRASTSRRGTAMHDLRVRPAKQHPSHAGNPRFAGPLAPKDVTENPQNPASPQSKKQGEKRQAKDRHSPTKTTARFRTDGAVVLEGRPRVVVLVLLRLGFGVHLRAQRRDSRALVLRWPRMVVIEKEVALEVVEGRSSRKKRPAAGCGL
ncbi:hypothetical protein C8J57DRAFT_1459537 [Mycena rebaudengoi]|nr:hypothetical protein C8J57DRAFT_1459537 [Mycena rebaudengoi]